MEVKGSWSSFMMSALGCCVLSALFLLFSHLQCNQMIGSFMVTPFWFGLVWLVTYVKIFLLYRIEGSMTADVLSAVKLNLFKCRVKTTFLPKTLYKSHRSKLNTKMGVFSVYSQLYLPRREQNYQPWWNVFPHLKSTFEELKRDQKLHRVIETATWTEKPWMTESESFWHGSMSPPDFTPQKNS